MSVGAGPVDWTSMAGTDDLPPLVRDTFQRNLDWFAKCVPLN